MLCFSRKLYLKLRYCRVANPLSKNQTPCAMPTRTCDNTTLGSTSPAGLCCKLAPPIPARVVEERRLANTLGVSGIHTNHHTMHPCCSSEICGKQSGECCACCTSTAITSSCHPPHTPQHIQTVLSTVAHATSKFMHPA
jgi:hypothetical protein